MSCSSSNSRVGVDADLDKNVLTITPYSVGKATVTVSINDQQICKLTINTILVQMSTNSALLAIKETKQLRVKGAPAVAIKWSSTNPKVVTVSSKALARMLLFSVILTVMGLIPDVLSWISGLASVFDGVFTYGKASAVVGVISGLIDNMINRKMKIC